MIAEMHTTGERESQLTFGVFRGLVMGTGKEITQFQKEHIVIARRFVMSVSETVKLVGYSHDTVISRESGLLIVKRAVHAKLLVAHTSPKTVDAVGCNVW